MEDFKYRFNLNGLLSLFDISDPLLPLVLNHIYLHQYINYDTDTIVSATNEMIVTFFEKWLNVGCIDVQGDTICLERMLTDKEKEYADFYIKKVGYAPKINGKNVTICTLS